MTAEAGSDRGEALVAVGRLGAIQVDCADPVVLARFWARVFGSEMQEALGDPPHYVNLGPWAAVPGAVMVAFQRVPENKAGKNRLHFDVEVDDVESATAQIEALGGTRAPTTDFHEYGYHWRVMADPEGNEFCLIYASPD
jgi:predicted enzyme related to lactoylglutathione lyase